MLGQGKVALDKKKKHPNFLGTPFTYLCYSRIEMEGGGDHLKRRRSNSLERKTRRMSKER